MEIAGDTALSRVETVLDYLTRRHEALSANVANASTPGYRSVDVRFDDVLGEELDNLRIVRTSDKHFEIVASDPEMTVYEVEGQPPGADGNNVELDRELLSMSLNRLRFQMGVQAAMSRVRTLKAAIQEGRA